jgi:hypothetical protein
MGHRVYNAEQWSPYLLKLTAEVRKMAVVDVTFIFSLRAMGRNQCDASVLV